MVRRRLLVLGLRASENLNVALNNVEAVASLAILVLVGAGAGITLDKDAGTLGQCQEIVLAGTLGEAGDAEPRSLAVFAGARVAGDGVLDDLAAAVCGHDLGRVGEVADNGDAGNGARRRGAKGAGGRGRRGGGATE